MAKGFFLFFIAAILALMPLICPRDAQAQAFIPTESYTDSNGIFMSPVKSLVLLKGGGIYYDNARNKIFISLPNENTVILTPGSNIAIVNGEYEMMSGPVRVVNGTAMAPIMSLNKFTQTSITSISPDNKRAGYETFALTVVGHNFSPGAKVKLGEYNLNNINVISSTHLTAEVPEGIPPGTYSLLIQNTDGSGGTLNSCFRVIDVAPLLYSIDPEEKDEGYSTFVMTVIGTNFDTGTKVTIGGSYELKNIRIYSTTRLTGEVPTGIKAGVYDVRITNSDGWTDSIKDGFRVEGDGPTITGVDIPNNIRKGYSPFTITVRGTNFRSGIVVTVGGHELSDIERSGSNKVSGEVPAGLDAGSYEIKVKNSDGTTATASKKLVIE